MFLNLLSSFRKPKFIFLISFLIILTLALIYFYFRVLTFDRQAAQLQKSFNKDLVIKYSNPSIASIIDDQFNIVKNKSNDENKRYQALVKLTDSISGVYFYSNEPYFRNFIRDDVNKYAKTNLSKNYNSEDFNLNCSDTTCSQGIPPEIKSVINTINSSDLDDAYKETVIKNLTNMSYLSKDQAYEKRVAGSFILEQLNETGNSIASQAAEQLKKYFQDNYNLEI